MARGSLDSAARMVAGHPQSHPRQGRGRRVRRHRLLESAAAIDRVLEEERRSDVCAAFFAIMDDDGSHRVYEALKTYD